jgi:hypothetical protein
MLPLVFVLSLLVTHSSALRSRLLTSSCPLNSVVNTTNFTLFAVYKENPKIQKQLFLGFIDKLASSVASQLMVLFILFCIRNGDGNEPICAQAAESVDTSAARNFSMTNGTIIAYAPDGTLFAVSKLVEQENSLLPFVRPYPGMIPLPTGQYCELVSPDHLLRITRLEAIVIELD